MSAPHLKVAVLISGGGSNLNALIQAIAAGDLAVEIVRVVSNRAEAGGLKFALDAGIPVSVIPHQQYAERAAHDRAIAEALDSSVVDGNGPELIILAGYMRILSADFARRFSNRMINLHPSLLPLYKGLDTYNRAIAAGDQYTGASVHVVTADLDDGPVISQVRITIEAHDNAATLAAKLGPLEHKLLLATAREFSQGHLKMMSRATERGPQAGSQVTFKGQALNQPLQLQADGSLQKVV